MVVALPGRARNKVRRRVLDRAEERLLATSPPDVLIRRLRRPAPLIFRTPGLVSTRLVETWVHHEDLRRVDASSPRTSDNAIGLPLWRAVRLISRRMALPAGVAVTLRSSTGHSRSTGQRRRATVEISGPPGELLLFILGRREQARVQLAGRPAALNELGSGPPLL
jgi:hypothetical protein